MNASTRRRTGFTLLEMLLALSISSLVGLTVMTMLHGIVVASQAEFDTRSAIVREQVVCGRLAAAARMSSRVLAATNDHIVLWTGDSRRNFAPDLSELRRIDWNAAGSELIAYEAPESLSDVRDTTYAFATDDFSAITDALIGSATFPGAVVAQDVVGWSAALDAPDPRFARLVRLDVTVRSPSGDRSATVIAHMRQPAD